MQSSLLIVALVLIATVADVAALTAEDTTTAPPTQQEQHKLQLQLQQHNSTTDEYRALRDVPSCYNYYYDIDMPGYDWYKIAARDVFVCRIQCIIEDDCLAFTWTPQDGGTCYLKTGFATTGATFLHGAVTALKGCPSNVLTLLNCDIGGHDVGSTRGKSVDDCPWRCAARDPSDCLAWTWSDHNGGTCWFKSHVAACVGDGNNKHSGLWSVYDYY